MGVKGLWHLLAGCGTPLALESLENKILAVDISIWLYQVIHGQKHSCAASLDNAQLLFLFHRICKLLFYKIRPVFVFDGSIPELKKQTLLSRRIRREIAADRAKRGRERLLSNFIKKFAIKNVLNNSQRSSFPYLTKESQKSDLYELPSLNAENSSIYSENDSNDGRKRNVPNLNGQNIHDFQIEQNEFKLLPLDVQHEVLTELQETRKGNSWYAVDKMPPEAKDFSNFQMGRLLKRHKFQTTLDDVRAKIRRTHAAEMEAQLFDELEKHVSLTYQIISEDNLHSILVKTFSKEVDSVRNESTTDERKVVEKCSEEYYEGENKIQHKDLPYYSNANSHSSNDDKDSDNELTQEELMHLIQETKKETAVNEEKNAYHSREVIDLPEYNNDDTTEIQVTQEELMKQSENWTNSKVETNMKLDRNEDLSKPSTSMVISAEMNIMDSSDEDNDFVDVPIPLDDSNNELYIDTASSVLNKNEAWCNYSKKAHTEEDNYGVDVPFPYENTKYIDVNIPSLPILKKNEERCTDSQKPGSVIDMICETKTESLYLKIIQNYLNDLKKCSKSIQTTEQNEIDFTVIEDSPALNSSSRIVASIDKELPPSINLSDENLQSLIKRNVYDELKSQICSYNLDLTNELRDKILEITESSLKKFVASSRDDICNISDNVPCKVPESENCNITENATVKSAVTESGDLPKDCVGISNCIQREFADMNKKSELDIGSSENSVSSPSEFDALNINVKELMVWKSELDNEQSKLLNEVKQQERIAGALPENIYVEAQELLKIFGLPYLVAPMEAEAQCAFLESAGLTQGTITNDSDIFLFGGKKVYKNFFNQKKHVEFFQSENIKYNYNLNQEKMITLAMLTGSDYTSGIESVGIVLGMEILAEFPGSGIKCLENFKEWWSSAHRNKSDMAESKIKQRAQHLYVPESFPCEEIFQAYLSPRVDESRENFSWGIPDIKKIRDYAAAKFGWDAQKTDTILKPVFTKLGVTDLQTRIDSYFPSIKLLNENKKNPSKRLKTAISQTKKK